MTVNYTLLNIKNIKICSLEEIKNYLRISYDYDDQLIINLMKVAINSAESFTGLSLNIKRVSCRINNAVSKIILKYVPILKIEKVSLRNTEKLTDITDKFGHLEIENFCINFANDYIGRDITIIYHAGYRYNIPSAIKQGILMHIASMYEYSEDGVILTSRIQNLYGPYRILKI